jgi:hypothetical protein
MTPPMAMLADLEGYLVEQYEVELWEAKHAVAAWLRTEPEIPATREERALVAERIYEHQEYWQEV